ncbi:MAG: DNA repair protein RadA, partial [Flavobacteriales bacterium]
MSAKVRSQFVCQNCGAVHAQWLGQCGTCKEWNTLVEEVRDRVKERGPLASLRQPEQRPVAIEDISAESGPRASLGDRELDRVLGGGVVPGSLI